MKTPTKVPTTNILDKQAKLKEERAAKAFAALVAKRHKPKAKFQLLDGTTYQVDAHGAWVRTSPRRCEHIPKVYNTTIDVVTYTGDLDVRVVLNKVNHGARRRQATK